MTSRLPVTPALPARYEIRRHIATGGMASVWCAHDALLGRSVAIKVLAPQLARDDRSIRRFKREARAAARLSGHPHVVTIYDVGETEGRPYIVMEHLAGGTVADAIRVGAVQRANAVQWLRQAASALDYAHAHGVVHRDIKPGNLLLARDRTLYVADFGIAQLATEDTLTSAGQLLGTATYLSPEQALGQPATDASDRYALAVAAFELLVGERPFTAEHFAEQARQHIELDPPRASRRNRGLPRAVDAVLVRGMAKRPSQRWPTAQAFVSALEGALEHPTRARVASAWRPGRAATRARVASAWRPGRAGAVVSLAAACAALAAVLVIGHGGAPDRGRPVVAATRNAPERIARPTHPSAVQRKAPATAPPATAPPATTTQQATATPATAAALEARGHQLMLDGDYAQAIGVLHQAIAAAAPGDINYAYALYDLGRSLRMSGDPKAAIPVLERRLQIPNQTPVVLTELRLAQRAVAASAQGSGAGAGGSASPAQPGGAPASTESASSGTRAHARPGSSARTHRFHSLFATADGTAQGD